MDINIQVQHIDALSRTDDAYVVEPDNPDREPTSTEPPATAIKELDEYIFDTQYPSIDHIQSHEARLSQGYLYVRNFGGWYATLPREDREDYRRIPMAVPPTAANGIVNDDGSTTALGRFETCTQMFLQPPWTSERHGYSLYTHRLHEDVEFESGPDEKQSKMVKTVPHLPDSPQKDHISTLVSLVRMPNINKRSKTQRGLRKIQGSDANAAMKRSVGHITHVNQADTGSDTLDSAHLHVDANFEKAENATVHGQLNTKNQSESFVEFKASDSILWQHYRFNSLDVQKLLWQLKFCQGLAIPENGRKLFEHHLFKRLQKDYEISSASGSYLQPACVRYIFQYPKCIDESCIFVNFPYLSLMSPPLAGRANAQPSQLPRGLLQSRYRRHDTKGRDEVQSMRGLKIVIIRKFLVGSEPVRQHATSLLPGGSSAHDLGFVYLTTLFKRYFVPISDDRVDSMHRIHIPQLWAVLPGANNLLTCGFDGVEQICGEELGLAPISKDKKDSRKPLLKLRFRSGELSEDFTYPLEHCSSWYELLSKHLAIELGYKERETMRKSLNAHNAHVLKYGDHQKVEPSSLPASTESVAKDVPPFKLKTIRPHLQIEGQTRPLSAELWMDYQRSKPGLDEILIDVLRSSSFKGAVAASEEHMIPANDVPQTPSSPDSPPKSNADGLTASSHQTGVLRTDKLKRKPPHPDELAFRETSFFEWPVHQVLVEKTALSSIERAQLILDSVPTSIAALRNVNDSSVATSTLMSTYNSAVNLPSENLAATRAWIQTRFAAHLQSDEVEDLVSYFECLLQYYIPQHMIEGSHSGALNPYWTGIKTYLTAYSIVKDQQRAMNSILSVRTSVLNCIEMLRSIHLGARSIERIQTQDGNIATRENLMKRAKLFSSIVESFAHVLLLPTAAARSLDGDETVLKVQTDHIIDLLKRAEGRMIRDADQDQDLGTPGSVVTPEAGTMALISRLAAGVCGPAKFNFAGLYEHIVEKIALDVKKKASRNLLRTLDGYSEEVDVIVGVLQQQREVVQRFRRALDPSTYSTPSVKRILAFQQESKSIDAVVTRIHGTLQAFVELRERAKELSKENLRLVEAGQEKNSRYLFVFTLVTVIFLPLTVVAGYFGMNLKGVNQSPYGEWKFWEVATPLTLGTLLACVLSPLYM